MNPELSKTITRINEREHAIGLLRDNANELTGRITTLAIQQGKDLLTIKASLLHGDWQTWLEDNCPKISARTARVYMQLANSETKRQSSAVLENAPSISAALKLLSEPPKNETKSQTKRFPAYLEALTRLRRLIDYIARNPISQWPAEGLQKFRAEFEPLAAQVFKNDLGLLELSNIQNKKGSLFTRIVGEN